MLHLLLQSERLLSGTLSAYLSAVATEMTVNNPPDVDRLPTLFELEPDSATPETVRITAVSGNVCTIERGVYNSGVGSEHQSNSAYKQKITSEHWQAVVNALEDGYLTEDSSLLPITRDSATQFTLVGEDHTSFYTKGRILRINDGDAFCTVVSSSLSGSDTVVVVDGDAIPSGVSAVTNIELAIMPQDMTAIQTLYADKIGEKTSAAGVTIDGMLIKDSEPYVDAVNEASAGAGVTIDGVLHKDGGITLDSGVAVDAILDEDNMASDSDSAIPTQQSVKAYVDSFGSGDGWTPYSAVIPTRASADDPTYVLTFAAVDLTSTIYPGMRVKFTQNGATVYGIVTKMAFSTDTTMTLYCGTDYDVGDTATYPITAFNYSTNKAPAGFPLSPDVWTVEITDTSSRKQNTPTQNIWYNVGTTALQIILPIGVWKVSIKGRMFVYNTPATNYVSVYVTLSSANNSESNADMTVSVAAAETADTGRNQSFYVDDIYTMTSKTTHYLNVKTDQTGITQIGISGDIAKTILRAVCAYL